MKKKMVIGLIAILVCAVVIIGIVLIKSMPKKEELKSKYPNLRWTVVNEKKMSEMFENMESQMAENQTWEALGVNEQFALVEYGENKYNSSHKEITKDMIEKYLGSGSAYGSEYEYVYEYGIPQTIKHTTIYKIKGISIKCAIAVKFEEKANYYIYVNRNYSTNTLGKLIEDLNLRENLQFSTIHYSEDINNNYMSFEFKGVPEDVIWKMLFNDTNARGKVGSGEDRLSIKVSHKLFGNEFTECTITENGYLSIHLFNTWYVYIGEEKAKAFFNYVFDNYKAEATVYINEEKYEPDGPGTIMVMENTL